MSSDKTMLLEQLRIVDSNLRECYKNLKSVVDHDFLNPKEKEAVANLLLEIASLRNELINLLFKEF